MISGWFGIHFRFAKLVRLLGIEVACILIVFAINGGGVAPLLKAMRGYWYVWAYVFVMLMSPVVDGFVETCKDRKFLISAFCTIAFLLWGWCFVATAKSPLQPYIPTVSGFSDSSGVVLLCLYVLVRLIRILSWDSAILRWPLSVLMSMFVVSGIFVFVGFRHIFGIFAFVFAFSALLLVKKIPVGDIVGRVVLFLGPSVFSVYIIHLPFNGYFSRWEAAINGAFHVPHGISQFILAVIVFFGSIVLDMPRRSAVWFIKKLCLKVSCLK